MEVSPLGMTLSGSPPPSLEELIARAKAQDRHALERLFHWCQPILDDWAARRLAKKQAGVARPSDIAQEARVRAFRSFPSFEGTTEAQFIAWLTTVFNSCTTQAFRDATRQKRDLSVEVTLEDAGAFDVSASHASPSEMTAAEEQWRLVLGWIFQLPEDQKSAIWLCHLKEMRVAEAAEHMGRSEHAVAGLLQRGLRALRERTGSDHEPQGGNPSAPSNPSKDNEELVGTLLYYLRLRDAGGAVDIESFVAEHPSCADELRAMLEWVERLQALRLGNGNQ